MNYRPFIPLSAVIIAATVLVAVPNEATPRERRPLEDPGIEVFQYTEDAYGNPNCGGACNGKPCCIIVVGET